MGYLDGYIKKLGGKEKLKKELRDTLEGLHEAIDTEVPEANLELSYSELYEKYGEHLQHWPIGSYVSYCDKEKGIGFTGIVNAYKFIRYRKQIDSTHIVGNRPRRNTQMARAISDEEPIPVLTEYRPCIEVHRNDTGKSQLIVSLHNLIVQSAKPRRSLIL